MRKYKVVRVEGPPSTDREVTCLGCGGPLMAREGKFALKYIRVNGGSTRRTR
jgi:hypothetical protein